MASPDTRIGYLIGNTAPEMIAPVMAYAESLHGISGLVVSSKKFLDGLKTEGLESAVREDALQGDISAIYVAEPPVFCQAPDMPGILSRLRKDVPSKEIPIVGFKVRERLTQGHKYLVVETIVPSKRGGRYGVKPHRVSGGRNRSGGI